MDRKRIIPNTITYNAAISACEKAGKYVEALKLLREMELFPELSGFLYQNNSYLISAAVEASPLFQYRIL